MGILAALLAVALVAGALHHYTAATQRLAERYVRALATRELRFKFETLTLQRAALAETDILPLYGTSELYCCAGAYNATYFFNNAPTGFAVFAVGHYTTKELLWAQTFADLGSALRGKRLVVSDSPWYFYNETPQEFARNFSPEVTTVFTFDAPVPWKLRSALAKQIVAFPGPLQGRTLLLRALKDAAQGGWRGHLSFWLLDPSGRVAAWRLEIQDAAETRQVLDEMVRPAPRMLSTVLDGVTARLGGFPRLQLWWEDLLQPPTALTLTQPLWKQMADPVYSSQPPLSANVPNQPRTIDWNAELAQASQQAAASTNNPFGVSPGPWNSCGDIQPVGGGLCQQALAWYDQGLSNHTGALAPVPAAWVQNVETCTCWTDLDLMLEVLRTVQARPLIWLQPLQGALEDETPYSAQARRMIYDRYLAIARAEGIPATTFQTHDTDPLYVNSFGHMSQRGWIYADRLMNLFWHGQLGEVRSEMAVGGSVDLLFPPALNCPTPAVCQGVDDVPPIPGEMANLPVGLAMPLPVSKGG